MTEVESVELRPVTRTCYRDEVVSEVVRVAKTISVPKEVPYEYETLVKVRKVDEQTIEINQPMFRWVDQEYTMDVPATDHQTTTSRVATCDGGCAEATCTCEVAITVPLKRTRKVKQYFTKKETKTVKHPYFAIESKKMTKMVTAMVPETVYDEKLVTKTIKVPYTVQEMVPVRVTRSVPQTTPCPCGSQP